MRRSLVESRLRWLPPANFNEEIQFWWDDPRFPSRHPFARHRTKAGPIRHEPLGSGPDGSINGMLWLGMRNYGWVRITVPGYFVLGVRDRHRVRDRYVREIMNAITTAWRC